MAVIHRAVGTADAAERYEAESRRVNAASHRFWDRRKGLFSDGRMGDHLHDRFSQQTNTWCVAADWVRPARTRKILKTLLDRDDPERVRCGPYFWAYLLPELARAGLVRAGLDAIETLWSPMVAAGATTLWETFAGDELDSYCHPWSAAPVEFLLRQVAGIPLDGGSIPAFHPRPDLLREVRARAATRQGVVEIEWHSQGAVTEFKGKLPATSSARIVFPDESAVLVSGTWTHSYRGRGRRPSGRRGLLTLLNPLTANSD